MPPLTAQCPPWAPSPGRPQAQSLVGGRDAAVISQVSKKQGSSKHSPKTLLCGDKFHNHADDPGSSRTCTQVYAWVFYLILEELVKFATEFLY